MSRRLLPLVFLSSFALLAWADDPYVQTTGTQYFLTDWYASPQTKAVIDVQPTDKDTVQQRFFGADAELDTVPFSFSFYINGSKIFSYACKDGTGNWVSTGQSVTTTDRWQFTLDAKGRKYDLRKTGAASATKSGTFDGKVTCTKTNTSVIAIAANNRDGEIMQLAKEKIYSFKLYDAGVLKRCYVPFWDATRTGLYELLSKTFVAASGTGDLGTGGDQPSDYSSYFAADDGWRWSTANSCVQVRGNVSAGEGGTVSVNGDTEAWANYGATLTFVATPADGQRFVCWLDDDLTNAQRGENPLTLTADRARRLRAKFADASIAHIHYVPGDFASLDAALWSDDVVGGDTIQIAMSPYTPEHTVDSELNKDVVVTVNKGVTIRGGDDPNDFHINCGGKGGIVLKHEMAKLTGVTITNFCNTTFGPVLRVASGLATNVLVNGKSSFSAKDSSTAAIFIGNNAEITDSKLMYLNYAYWSVGNLLTISGGRMRRTLVQNPKTISTGINVYSNGGVRGLVEDCTIASGWGWCNAIVSMSSSDMRRCVVSGGTSASTAQGVYLNNSTVSDTTFYGHYAEAKGARPVIAAAGTSSMTNCLLRGNTIYSAPMITLGATSTDLTLVNCTITGNKATAATEGGIGGAAGTCRLINTILWNNQDLNGDDVPFNSSVAGKLVSSNSCYKGAVEGDGRGNVNRDPLFVDAANKDYSLQLASPCVDTGLDIPELTHDLNDDTRPLSGAGGDPARWDIGCYEREALSIPLIVELFVTGTRGPEPYDVPLSVSVTGTKRTGLGYIWTAMRPVGGVTETRVVTNGTPAYTFAALPAGIYSFACTVTNDVGNSESVTNMNAFTVCPNVVHVSPNGSGEWPYDSPETGTQDLWHALTNAGTKVILHPGKYTAFTHKNDVDTGLECLGAVSVGLEVAGSDDPLATVIDCGGKGGLVINHADAYVHGVTFTNFLTASGCGHVLYVNNGLVSNVVVAGGVKATQNRSCLNVQVKGTAMEVLVTNVNMSAGNAASVTGGKVYRSRFIGNAGTAVVSAARADNGTMPVVDDCVLLDNAPSATLVKLNHGKMRRSLVRGNAHTGGGIFQCYGVEMQDCVVTNNSTKSQLMDFWTDNWVGDTSYLTNCLISANRIASGGVLACSGVVYPRCAVLNCTIADNVVAAGTVGGIGLQGHVQVPGGETFVKNSIVWGNTVAGAASDIVLSPPYTTLNAQYSCFAEAESVPDKNNIALDPQFETGGYLPKPGSPCVDSGAAIANINTDLEGRVRPLDGNGDGVAAWDLGCYELPTLEIPVSVSLAVVGSSGAEPADITLVATVVGKKLEGLSYEWRAIRTLGDVVTTNELQTLTDTCTFSGQLTGSYSFSCKVTNKDGDAATDTLTAAYRVLPPTVYVSLTGSDTWPYTTPETAAHDLWNAVTNAGTEVIVAPGVYTNFTHGTDEATGRECLAAVSTGLRIVGSDDPSQTVINCGGLGGLLVNHADAIVTGFTLTNFLAKAGSGAALYVNAGTVSNVVVKGGTALKVTSPSAIYLGAGAVMCDSLVANITNTTANAGAALSLSGGKLLRSRVAGCSGLARLSLLPSGNGDRSTVEDCEIVGNTFSATMITAKKTDLRRVLVKGNRMTSGSAITLYGATLRDSVFRDNTTAFAVMDNFTEGWIRMTSYLTNCLIVANATTSGGAVSANQMASPGVQLDYCTIVGNTAQSGYVGGVGGTGWNAENKFLLSVRNSIVWGNVADGKAADVLFGGSYSEVTANNSCFAEAASAPNLGNIAADPKFEKNYRIRAFSPCANTARVYGWERTGTDMDGNPRYFGKGPDMGCYECQRNIGMCLIVR